VYNIKTEVKGTTLVLTIDLTQKAGLSKSGKSEVIATTSGNATVRTASGEVKVGVNVYRPAATGQGSLA
jgi:hypothetical protein